MLKAEEIIEKVKADRATCRIVSAAGITISPEPETPPNRPGYYWVPYQAVAGGSIAWIESGYDASMPGTAENPAAYVLGVTVYPNYYYVLDGIRKVWMGAPHAAPAWDNEHFVKI